MYIIARLVNEPTNLLKLWYYVGRGLARGNLILRSFATKVTKRANIFAISNRHLAPFALL